VGNFQPALTAAPICRWKTRRFAFLRKGCVRPRTRLVSKGGESGVVLYLPLQSCIACEDSRSQEAGMGGTGPGLREVKDV
jgi:hypothetical protein